MDTHTLYDHAADVLRNIYDRRLSGPPVYDDAACFPAAQRFGAAWQTIRDEALNIAANLSAVPRFHEIMAQQADISAHDNRDWRMFVLKAYGVTFPGNAAQCPALAALVASEPDVLTATLSFLAPGKIIPEHRGPFRGILRYYLGLSVPPAADGLPGTTLTIDGAGHRIGDGQWLLWDDTYPHAVKNDTGGVRIALLLDVRRRGMPPDMEALTRLLIGVAATAVRLRKLA